MSEYMPGAVQVPQPGGVTLDTSLPPRFVWHITWDALDATGHQPDFGAVAGYLQGKEWCPHIMWNPFTGYMEQYYPASVGSRALMYNDQDGAACVQVEIFFTPGCVVDGVKYATVADTPLKGWAELLAWADSLGVPRVWPMGAPQWSGNSRDVATWNGNAGHYGHCNSPGDDHTDPGPMPDLNSNNLEDFMGGKIDAQQAEDIVQAVTERVLAGIMPLLDNKVRINAVQAEAVATRAAALAAPAVLNAQFPLPDGTKTNLPGVLAAISAKPSAAGVAAVFDPAAIEAAIISVNRTQWNK